MRPMSACLELFGKRKDGSELPADILALIRDITERKWMEEELASPEAPCIDSR